MAAISLGLVRFLRLALAAGVLFITESPGSAQAAGNIFDELRFGASTSVQGGHSHEDGIFPEVTVFLDPFGFRDATDWKQQLVRPRINIGTSISTQGEATQVFSGLSWTVNFTRKAFIEAGFGGVVHNGTTKDTVDGPSLGCSVLFHEYVGLGYGLTRNWDVIGQIAHSSHANLCNGNNDGMTRAGLQLGYKF